jgi:hypothetical protein
VSIFHRESPIYLRHPNGGIEGERLAAMKNAGYGVALLTVHAPIKLSNGLEYPPYDLRPWESIIKTCENIGLVWAPWAFLWHDYECYDLRRLALEAGTRQGIKPLGCWNAERPLGDGKVTIARINTTSTGCDTLLSTEPWPFDNVNYSALRADIKIEAQLFPMSNEASKHPRNCRSKFYQLGAKRVGFQLGVKEHGIFAKPTELPYREQGTVSLYSGDDLNGKFNSWTTSKLPPLDESVFPYNGPWYGPSSSTGLMSRHPQIVQLKQALHNAGFADFARPDTIYNFRCETAVRNLQRFYGVRATGQYGLRTWTLVKKLPSANPHLTYAVPL